MSGPGDAPSSDDDPTAVLPDDPSIWGPERVVAYAAEGEADEAEAEAAGTAGAAGTTGQVPVAGRPEEPAADAEPVEPAETSRSGLLRSSAVVGLGTGLSRITGLVRVLALAYALGSSLLSDGYTLANVTPNIIYELLLGGVLSATLIPVFIERREHGDDDAIDAAVTTITLFLLVLTGVAVLAAPLIFDIFTIGKDPAEAAAQASVAVPLMRWFAPQIFFYGLTAVATALLNSRKRFAAPAFAPVLNNVVLVCVLIEMRRLAGGLPTIEQVAGDPTLLVLLGLGTTAGIAAMTVVLWPAIRRAGIRLRPRFDFRNPVLRTIGGLSGWTLGYVVANQVALIVVLTLANGLGKGPVTSYSYAFVFFQLPHGLLAVSLMTTYMPELSMAAARQDLATFRVRFVEGARMLFLLVMPAAVGLVLLARPLMSALFEYGDFKRAGPLTADILRALALGLPAFSIYLFVLRGFYALKDTKTPFLVNLLENGVNIVLALAVIGALEAPGLGLAYSAAYTAGAALALVLLARRVGRLWSASVAASVSRTLVASAVMAASVYAVTLTIGSAHGAGAILRCGVAVAVGAVVYFGVLVLLRSEDVDGLTRRLRRRRPTPTVS